MAVYHNEGEEDGTTTSFVEEGGGDHQRGMCVQRGLTHSVAIIRYTVQAEIRDDQQSVEVRGGGICAGRRKRLTYSLGNSPIANTHSRLVWEWGTGRQRGLSMRKAGGGVSTFPQAPSPTITSFLRI